MDDIPKYMVMNPLFVSKRNCYIDRFYDSVIERLREKAIFLKTIRDSCHKTSSKNRKTKSPLC